MGILPSNIGIINVIHIFTINGGMMLRIRVAIPKWPYFSV
jgi:hypothetical protein